MAEKKKKGRPSREELARRQAEKERELKKERRRAGEMAEENFRRGVVVAGHGQVIARGVHERDGIRAEGDVHGGVALAEIAGVDQQHVRARVFQAQL